MFTKPTKQCLECNNDFYPLIAEVNRGKGKLCSVKCRRLWQRKVLKGKGKGYCNWGGYHYIWLPYIHPRTKHLSGKTSCYVKRCILVVEKALNRPLNKDELIHHIDRDKMNDKLENLYLFPSIAEHSRYHANLYWKKISPLTKSNLINH